MTDTEQQLRRMLEEKCGADSVHLLDAWKAEWQQATGCADPETIEDRLHQIARLLGKSPTEGIPDAIGRLQRSLSALREAVGPFLAVAKAVDPCFIRDDNTVWHAGPSAVVTVGDCRKLLTAADGAPVPTLTLEEVEKAAGEAVESILEDLTDRRGLKHEWRQTDAAIQDEIRAEWRRRLKPILERIAQKGAGRGE